MEIATQFETNGEIPIKYTCDGQNINPPLEISEIPPNTKTLAIIVEDTDAKNNFVHWIMFNIPVTTSTLVLSEDSHLGTEGLNGKGETGYTGPCPPKKERHRYFFKVYALDAYIESATGVNRENLEEVMGKHIIDSNQIVGVYQR
jgi:Raf kinase inhibitor-like YbhB/YbcL family protein